MRWLPMLLLSVSVLGCQAKTEKSPEVEAEPNAGQPEVPKPVDPPFEPLVPPTDEEIQAGWIQLFDGETLFGWEANDAGSNNPVNWRVEDGVITADSAGQSLLLTYVPFADYELRLEYRLEAEGNSGVFLRTVPNPTDPAVDCYELNLCENHESHPTGSLVGRHKADRPLVNDNQWIPVLVTVNGPTIKATIGEDEILNFTDTSKHILKSGRIGLQKNEGKIEFRNVALKPLGTEPIFNGKDLSGWRVVPGSESQFEVKDGTIHVTADGLGFLETEETWADFLLQAEAITHGEGLNSGIFFRGLPGEEGQSINGYEMQIQHQQSPIDDKKFTGDRTGGIFRQADPRKVVSKDNEWCQLTLVAAGPRFATWVNGYPVVTWEDERDPDENPRRGLRLKAGHISLQGHDETTDLEFRNIELAPLPK